MAANKGPPIEPFQDDDDDPPPPPKSGHLRAAIWLTLAVLPLFAAFMMMFIRMVANR